MFRTFLEYFQHFFFFKKFCKLNEKEILESLQLAEFNSSSIEQISACSRSNKEQIKTYLSNLKLDTKSYHDLEWRVDYKLASRSIRKCAEPEILLKLDLKTPGDGIETRLLKTDVTNLAHLTATLEEALNEMKTNYCRRVTRNLV